MLIEALIAATLVALLSISGAFFFGGHKGLVGIERYVIPVAVGVFMSLVLYELIPETLESSPQWGGLVVATGFLSFYILAQYLHHRYHEAGDADCDRKGAAMLLLVGDAVHNLADGVILGAAFMIDPAVGIATTIGLALHEIPQEIVEFGVFIRAGYSIKEAIIRNFVSASTIILGTLFTMLVGANGGEWVWVLTGLAAGNLLFLAASDLLPRIHGNLEHYGSVWKATGAVVFGFVLMTSVIQFAHSNLGHNHNDHEGHDHVMIDGNEFHLREGEIVE